MARSLKWRDRIWDDCKGERPKGLASRRCSPLQNNAPVQMKPKSLSSLMSGFKSITTKKINILRDAPATPLWQRNAPLHPPSLGDFQLFYPQHLGRAVSFLNKEMRSPIKQLSNQINGKKKAIMANCCSYNPTPRS